MELKWVPINNQKDIEILQQTISENSRYMLIRIYTIFNI